MSIKGMGLRPFTVKEKLKIKDKGHMGMYFIWVRVSKSAALQRALMGPKTISFGTVMTLT
jgi:hypothetical protein